MVYVLWGLKNGLPSWQEDFLGEYKTLEQLNAAKAAAKNNDYSTRVLMLNGFEKPDFIGTIK